MAIISFIFMIVMNDSAILLLGESRCWSLLGFKRFRKVSRRLCISCLCSKLVVKVLLSSEVFRWRMVESTHVKHGTVLKTKMEI